MSNGEPGQKTGYEIVFADGNGSPQPVPEPGETLQIGDATWTVQGVDQDEGHPRLRLARTDGADDEVEAHRRRTVVVHPPSSFETELVYTLNDLSTRLSVLAATLNAYWGKGAA
jgi:hypothetical protein